MCWLCQGLLYKQQHNLSVWHLPKFVYTTSLTGSTMVSLMSLKECVSVVEVIWEGFDTTGTSLSRYVSFNDLFKKIIGSNKCNYQKHLLCYFNYYGLH